MTVRQTFFLFWARKVQNLTYSVSREMPAKWNLFAVNPSVYILLLVLCVWWCVLSPNICTPQLLYTTVNALHGTHCMCLGMQLSKKKIQKWDALSLQKILSYVLILQMWVAITTFAGLPSYRVTMNDQATCKTSSGINAYTVYFSNVPLQEL